MARAEPAGRYRRSSHGDRENRMPVLELGDVIATRALELTAPAGAEKKILIKIGNPLPLPLTSDNKTIRPQKISVVGKDAA